MKKKCIAALVLLSGLGLQGNAYAGTVLTYSDFSSTAGYGLYGNAVNSETDLQLIAANQSRQVGSVYFTSPVDVTSFNSSFSFSIAGKDGAGGADGLAFVIKSTNSSTLGGVGGNLGYGGIGQSVAVEIDIHSNAGTTGYNDVGDNHVGIDVNGNMSSIAYSPKISPNFDNTDIWYVWVDYDGAILSVYLNQQNSKPGSATLTYGSSETPFVIKDYVGSSSGLVGFTAATGGVTQTALLKSFNHNSPNPEPSTYVLLGIGALIAGMVGRRRLGDGWGSACFALRKIVLRVRCYGLR